MRGGVLSTISPTHISDIFSGNISRISAPRISSMTCGVPFSSTLLVEQRRLTVSPPLGHTAGFTIRSVKRFPVSGRVSGLPVTNIRAHKGFPGIWFRLNH